MTSESEVTFGAILARMWRVGHVFGNLRQIGIQDHRTIQLDFDRWTFYGHDLVIPLAGWTQIAASCSGHAVCRAVSLSRIELAILGMLGIEHLQLTHAHVSRIAFTWIANSQAVVAARWQLEFDSSHKVRVHVFGTQHTTMTGLALNRAVDDFIVVLGTSPTG